MLKVDRVTGKLVRMTEPTLTDAGCKERGTLQELILGNADAFFQEECKETLYVLGDEMQPSPEVGDRIDLLAIDPKGRAVIIELKRGSDKFQLLQALSYAAMISDWDSEKFDSQVPEARKSQYKCFLEEHDIEIANVNEFQRVILIAESFDFEVLKTAEWLTALGLNITCYKLQLARESVNTSEYLSVAQVFPPRELADHARRRGSLRSERANKSSELEQLLVTCDNPDIVSYFNASLTIRRNKSRSSLVYPPNGKMRFRVRPKLGYARVSQLGRFEGDETYWSEHLSKANTMVNSAGLRFRLYTTSDVIVFIDFTERQLATTVWVNAVDSEEDDEVDES
jgi:hypothetical protein